MISRIIDRYFALPQGAENDDFCECDYYTLDQPSINLRTLPLLVVLAHTLIALPLDMCSVLPALRTILPCLREAAALSVTLP